MGYIVILLWSYLSVGGLGFIGYLTVVSDFLYIGLGPTMAIL